MDVNLTGSALVDQVAKQTGLDVEDVRKVWQASLDMMHDVLLAHGTIQLRNIGRLKVRQMPDRKHYDINTESTRMIKGREVLAVRTSKVLREQLEATDPRERKRQRGAWAQTLAPYHRTQK